MSKRTKTLTRELHERGLRKRLARRVARSVAAPRAEAEPPPEVRELAESLRRLAADIEAEATGEHAEPQASARRAAHPVSTDGADGGGARFGRTARPRARRN